MFRSNFSGNKLKGSEDEAASPARWTNHHTTVPIRPVNPSPGVSENGISTTDDFSLHL
jgi:hypothetical protein